MTNTPTPLTDAVAKAIGRSIADYIAHELTLASFAIIIDRHMDDARQLEQDLNEAKLWIEKSNTVQYVMRIEAELEEYRSIAESVGATKAVSERDKALDLCRKLELERDKWKAAHDNQVNLKRMLTDNRVALHPVVRREIIVETKLGTGIELSKLHPRDDGQWDKYCWIGCSWQYNDTVCNDTVCEWCKEQHYVSADEPTGSVADFRIEQLSRALHIAMLAITGTATLAMNARSIARHAIEHHGAKGDLWKLPPNDPSSATAEQKGKKC